jgi:hypothetical protein
VAHACNPSYSGGRDQEDCSSKPAWTTVGKTLSQKNPSQKTAGEVALSSNPSTEKQKERKKDTDML